MMKFSLLVLVSPMYEKKSDWENHCKSVNHALCDPCQPWAEKKQQICRSTTSFWSGCTSRSRSQGELGDVAAILIPWKVGDLSFPLELQYAVSLERCPFPTKFLNKEYQNINHSFWDVSPMDSTKSTQLLAPHKAHRSKELHTSFPTRSSTTNLMNSLVTSSLKQGLHQVTLISELFINNFINQNFLWKTGGGTWWWNYSDLVLEEKWYAPTSWKKWEFPVPKWLSAKLPRSCYFSSKLCHIKFR